MASSGAVKRSQVKVGALMLVALSAVAALVLLLSGNSGIIFASKLNVRVYFKNSGGLKVGSPVNLDGVTIGNVRAIRILDHPRETPVEVVMAIRDQYRRDLLTDSRANLNTIGVLGSTEIDIDNVHASGKPIENDGVLLTGGAPNLENALSAFQDTTQKFGTTLSEGNVLLSNLSSRQGSIGKLINDPKLRDRAASAVSEFSSIPVKASEGRGTIGKLMTDNSLMNHLQDMQAKLSDISASVENGQGTAGKILKDPALSINLKEASEQMHQISTEASSGQGAVGMMVKDREFQQKLKDTGGQMRSIAAETSSGRGTMGKMMSRNSPLDLHLDELMKNSRELVTGMRNHPVKYFSIHLRLF
jgi:phospholipid/cholesterol/gamma-HCH transport system substrate-binding protein